VTTSGDILKFKISDVYYTSTAYCTIELDSISVKADGTFDLPIPSSIQSLDAMHISGKFNSDTTMTGTFKLQVCGDTIVNPTQTLTWSAEWNRP
jgi:hypothetical protein